MINSVAQLREWPKLERQVRNKSSFAPPATGELTPVMVDRFVKAQQAIKAKLGTRVDELDRKYKALEQSGGSSPSFSEAMGALKDLGGLIMDAKRAQVEALNEHGFSVAEYEWVRGAVYAASGIPVETNFSELVERASRGELDSGESVGQAVTGPVPEVNRELVKPHHQTLTDNAGMAFFGL